MSREELPYYITSLIFRYFIIFVSVAGYIYFVRDFLSKRKNACYVGVFYLFILLLFDYFPWKIISNFNVHLVAVLMVFMVMYALERQFLRQKLFLAIAFFSIRGLSFDIAGVFYTSIYEWTIKTPFLMLTDKRQLLTFVACMLSHILLCMVMLFVFLKLCKRSYRIKNEEMSVQEFVMLTTPCIAFSIGRLIISFYQFFYEEQMQQLGNKPYDFISFFYYVIALLTIVMVIIQSQKIKEQAEKQKLQELLVQQLHDMHSHTKEAERLYEEIRGLKHDMGNHIQIIKGLWENKAEDEAEQYFEKLMEVYQSSAGEVKTGHPVTDVLLAEKEKTMKQMGISFENDFHFPVGMEIDVFDISVLLNNALDNAMEACKELLEDRAENTTPVFIHLSVCQREHILLLEMTNSCKAVSLKYQDAGIYASTKREAGHGFGLKNMRIVAEKYMGTLECKQEENLFSLIIMLQG